MATSITKPSWKYASESILEEVFNNIPAEQLQLLYPTCTNWDGIARSNAVWARKVRKEFEISTEKKIVPHAKSWFDEYERLSKHTPKIKSQEIHFSSYLSNISFSEDGKMFVTCETNGVVKIWSSAHSATELYMFHVGELRWIMPSYAKLNKDNTKLIVAGLYLEQNSINEEGASAVFSLEGKLDLNFTFANKPKISYAAWFCTKYFVSGYVSRTETGSRLDIICLTNANSTQKDVIMNPIYTLDISSNRNTISNLLVASMDDDSLGDSIDKSSLFYDKLLIYRSNISRTNNFLVCFKKFRNMEFFKNMDKYLSIEEVIAYREKHPPNEAYDTEDKVVMVDGIILSMALCPTNRYLYLNVHKIVNHPYYSEINEFVIDLRTFEITATPFKLFEEHRQPVGTPPHILTNLAVSNHFILGGGVQRPACLLERHYGVPLAQLPLNCELNFVALNENEEMLLIVDDGILTIYRSLHKLSKSKLDLKALNEESNRALHSLAELSIVTSNNQRIPMLNSTKDFPPISRNIFKN